MRDRRVLGDLLLRPWVIRSTGRLAQKQLPVLTQVGPLHIGLGLATGFPDLGRGEGGFEAGTREGDKGMCQYLEEEGVCEQGQRLSMGRMEVERTKAVQYRRGGILVALDEIHGGRGR